MKLKSGEAATSAKSMGETNAEAFKTAAEAAGSWLSTYSSNIDNWVNKTGDIAGAVNGIITAYSNLGVELDTLSGKYNKVI